jgi:hypothetical protein
LFGIRKHWTRSFETSSRPCRRRMIPQGTAVFLDTSIIIAKSIHCPEIRNLISERLKSYNYACSGLVARRELKQTILKDANYLLNLSFEPNGMSQVLRRIGALHPTQQRRSKRFIGILAKIFEKDDERNNLLRLRLYCRFLLKNGFKRIEEYCDFLHESGCAIADTPITERKISRNRYSFDLGEGNCKNTNCRITEFLKQNLSLVEKIKDYLTTLSANEKTKELKKAEYFINSFLKNPDDIKSLNPCLNVGDLLIGLESKAIKEFYTMNEAESKHYGKVLEQKVIIRPPKASDAERILDYSK